LNAANCASISISQDINSALLAGSKTKLSDFVQSCQEQIADKYKDLFDEDLPSINYTTSTSGTSTRINFNLLVGCSETTTTTSADGKVKTTEVASKVNKTKVQDVISCGLFLLIFELPNQLLLYSHFYLTSLWKVEAICLVSLELIKNYLIEKYK